MRYRHIDEMERERIANWPAPRTRLNSVHNAALSFSLRQPIGDRPFAGTARYPLKHHCHFLARERGFEFFRLRQRGNRVIAIPLRQILC